MRKNGLDLLRGIAAFGIVGCHLGLSNRTPVGMWVTALCDFNVGLFAAISGFLMKDGDGYVKRRAKRILPVYLVWSLVYIVATAIFDIMMDGGQLNERYCSLRYWAGVLFLGDAAAHLWFLICLFYAQCILSGIVSVCRLKSRGAMALLALVSVLLLICSVSWDNWYCKYPLRLLAFLSLGYLMKRYAANRITIPLIGIVLMLGVHLGLHGVFHGFVRDYLLVIPVMMFFSSDWFSESKLTAVLCVTSLGVYLIHLLFVRAASWWILRTIVPPYSAFVVLAEWVIVWCISLLAVVMLKKVPFANRFLR